MIYAKCPYCNNDLNVIDVAIENLKCSCRPNQGYSSSINAMTKCCGKVIKISGKAYIKFSVYPYLEENMPTEDDFGNEIGKPIIRN